MADPIHFIVSKSRQGWAVNVDADQLSEHEQVEGARTEANRLAELAREEGEDATFVDLSDDQTPGPKD